VSHLPVPFEFFHGQLLVNIRHAQVEFCAPFDIVSAEVAKLERDNTKATPMPRLRTKGSNRWNALRFFTSVVLFARQHRPEELAGS